MAELFGWRRDRHGRGPRGPEFEGPDGRRAEWVGPWRLRFGGVWMRPYALFPFDLGYNPIRLWAYGPVVP